MGETEISAFLTHLAVNKHVTSSTQNQALSTLLFLYKQVLNLEVEWIDDVIRTKRPKCLPVVLSREGGLFIILFYAQYEWHYHAHPVRLREQIQIM